ncbi:MAG: SEC-C domain-containing protein, partial [Firmicutes bacterium]|nr:SEC-C domain-containing protein [Bacillota bacterium]
RDSKDESPIDYGIFSRMVERAQKQIEGNNFDRRKTVLQYDEVLRKQREVIYNQRRSILFEDSIIDIVTDMIDRAMTKVVQKHVDYETKPEAINDQDLFKVLDGKYFAPGVVEKSKLQGNVQEVLNYVLELVKLDITEKIEKFSEERFNEFLKVVVLRVVDTYWVQHIDQMSELRQGIGLQSYAQMNPLREYQEVGFAMFEELVSSIEDNATKYVLRAVIRDNLQRVQVAKPTSTSSGKDEEIKRKPRIANKIGRNDPCPCGSGKKYKQCHGA